MKKVSEEFIVGKSDIGYVDSSFTKEFGNDEFITTKSQLISHKLTRSMTDSEIIKEFGVQECTLSEVMAIMLSPTPDMKDGYSNIFYIKGHPSHVVCVGWYGGRWGVGGWNRGVGHWGAGDRVFSPATATGNIGTLNSGSMTLESAIKICKEAGLKVIRITQEEL